MKEEYIVPTSELIEFDSVDVITTSGDDNFVVFPLA